MQHQRLKPIAELFRFEILLDLPVQHQRHPTGLFRDHEGDGIGFFAQPDGRAVTRAQVLGDAGVDGERQKTGGSSDPILLDDDRAVVQG